MKIDNTSIIDTETGKRTSKLLAHGSCVFEPSCDHTKYLPMHMEATWMSL